MSAQSIPVLELTFKAVGAVASRRAIGYGGTQATVRGQKILGVSPRPVDLGSYSEATVIGTAIVEAGAGFAIGASLVSDATGRAVAVNSAANPAEYVFADALEAAMAAGQFVEVLLRR